MTDIFEGDPAKKITDPEEWLAAFLAGAEDAS